MIIFYNLVKDFTVYSVKGCFTVLASKTKFKDQSNFLGALNINEEGVLGIKLSAILKPAKVRVFWLNLTENYNLVSSASLHCNRKT